MVTAQQRRYGEYILEDTQSRARVVVCPERGGAVVSFSVNGREVLWLDRDVYEDPTQNVQGGIPILFPICSILPDDAYQVKGQYKTITGVVLKVDPHEQHISIQCGVETHVIPFSDVYRIFDPTG